MTDLPGHITSDTELKCVCKPVQSAGSDDVFLCKTVGEAEVNNTVDGSVAFK
jgi:glutathione synthase/RimK-type ligase-like ATP-grasp enzyme